MSTICMMMLRRLLTVCLAAAFLVGATVQLLPPSTALAATGMHNNKMGGCAGPEVPPAKHMPNCIDNLGCLVVQAVPASPTTVAVPFRWTAVAYSLGTASLLGLSVEPELSPPILAA